MTAYRVVASFCLIFVATEASDCVDLVSTCASLQPICIGSILEYHFKLITDLSIQVNSSSIPALESYLPLLNSDFPFVLGTNGDVSSTLAHDGTGASSTRPIINDDSLKNALPLLKESLPLIRESLPLIRESLPLIRQFLNPLVGKPGCQRKLTCRSCKNCPKLRDTIISFVTALCPSTCKACTTNKNLLSSSTNLSSFFA